MASGVQGRASLAATTYTTVASQPASGKAQMLTVSFTNTTSTATTIRLAIVNNGTTTPANTDWLEYNQPLAGKETFERTGILLVNGQTLVAYSTVAGVNVVVYGLEDSAVAATVVNKYYPSATTWTTIAAGPAAGRIQTVNVNVTNSTAASIQFRLAVASNPLSPAAGDYIEYDLYLPPLAAFERTGIVLNNGLGIGVYVASAGLSVQASVIDDVA